MSTRPSSSITLEKKLCSSLVFLIFSSLFRSLRWRRFSLSWFSLCDFSPFLPADGSVICRLVPKANAVFQSAYQARFDFTRYIDGNFLMSYAGYLAPRRSNIPLDSTQPILLKVYGRPLLL